MSKRFIIIVLDGFGIGAMDDAAIARPGDEKANTLQSILKDCPDLKLPTLEKLGLMNAYGKESLNEICEKRQLWKKRVGSFWRRYLYGSPGDYGNFAKKT